MNGRSTLALRGSRRRSGRPAGWYGSVKRLTDLTGALIILAVAWPSLLAIGGLIRSDSPGPALFRQRRSGRWGDEFTVYKFRTMQVGTPDLASHLMTSSQGRVTRVGRILRRTSMDELPQLINVIRGEMSLVGPRPALYNQDDLIAMRRACGVDTLRPGITGLAQIEGRDALTLEAKVSCDRRYLEACSLSFDLRTAARTVRALAGSRGVN
jgi:O-antigen biosynthesis protein WbqP